MSTILVAPSLVDNSSSSMLSQFSKHARRDNLTNADIINEVQTVAPQKYPQLCAQVDELSSEATTKISQLSLVPTTGFVHQIFTLKNDSLTKFNNLASSFTGESCMLVAPQAYVADDLSSPDLVSTSTPPAQTTMSSGNTNMYALLVVLFSISGLMTQILSVDNEVFTLNQNAVGGLNDALNAITGLGNILDFPVKITNSDGTITTINDLYTLFEYVYATDANGSPLSSAANEAYEGDLNPLLKQLEEQYPSEMSSIESSNWGVANYTLSTSISSSNASVAQQFYTCFSDYESYINTCITQIDSTLTQISPLSYTTDSSTGTDVNLITLTAGSSATDTTATVASTNSQLDDMLTDIKSAVASGNNASSSLYTQTQADDTTYQQVYSVISSMLDLMKTIISKMWG